MPIAPQATKKSTEMINTWVYRYYNTTHYEALAKHVQKICKENLKDIPALVTYRYKKRESLRNKLMKISERKGPFEDFESIEGSIFDLAGVRIALYVPKQTKRVMNEMENWGFASVEWKGKRGKVKEDYLCKRCKLQKLDETECLSCRSKPPRGNASDTELSSTPGADSSSSPEADDIYKPAFAGYIADHARVKLTANQAKSLSDWKDYNVVEIQVVSVLLHAWAEVEHDIIYKSIRAEAGMEERVILDSLNGLIISSELLLDQLYTVHTNRAESLKEAFASKSALATFIDRYIGGEARNDLELKMLFGLLKAVRKDSHQKLHPILEELGFKKDTGLIDTEALGPRFLELVLTGRPFLLASNMQIPYFIMEYIVSKIGEEESSAAEERAKQGDPHRDGQRSYACRVILSSLVWLRQLYPGGSFDQVMQEVRTQCDDIEETAFNWATKSTSRRDILEHEEEPSKEDATDMEIIWNWFEKQDEGSFFSFVFKISRMGVFGLKDDFAHLREGYGTIRDRPSY